MSKPRDGGAGFGADRGADRESRGRQVDERICSYVDGCLAPREQERFVAELRVNPQLQKDLEEYQRTVAAVREALRAPTVPTRLADRVMAAIGTPAAPPRRAPVRTWQSLLWSVAAAAALLALALWLNAWEGGPSRTTVAQAPALDSSVASLALVPRQEDKAAEPLASVAAERSPAEREALVPSGEAEPLLRKMDSAAPPAAAILGEAGAAGASTLATSPAGASESKEKRDLDEAAREKDKTAAAAKSDAGAPVAAANDDPARRIVTRLVAPPTPSADVAAAEAPTPAPAAPEARRELAKVEAAEPLPQMDRRFSGAPVAGGGRSGGRGRGAPAGRTEPAEPVGTIPLVVFTADAKQVAAAQARGRSADAVTGADDFYLGSTRKAGAAAEEVPQLFGFLMQQFPGGPEAGTLAGFATVSTASPQQPGTPGSAGGPGAAKSAPSSGPSSPGPGSPGPGAPSAGATRVDLQLLTAGLPAPVFSRWQSLRFEALTTVPSADDVAGVGKERTAAPPPSPEVLGGGRAEADREQAPTAAVERTWLVEGRRTEVAELLRRLAALARESGFQVGNGELPADAPVLSARFRKAAEEAPPADVTAAPVVPPVPAKAEDAEPADRDVMRIVLRFQSR